ncbi:Unknown protein [Striga hermonthica]|uniref:KIB1-4 beta-propeller domain-containing protein n=1 Tax=Striga hermonthica TaxID=68872 RepID=A0A9N7MQB1_STRHE|nr:Unknown protein [Striga hermonthica]
MVASFSITRPICRKWFAGLSNYPMVWMTGSCSFRRFKFNSYQIGMSTLAEPMFSSSTRQNPSSSSSPWLMLPLATVASAGISYKFYSLADDKIVTLGTGKSRHERELTHPRMRFAGSSHGWLALLSRSLDLFLYNPISGRHIDLPSVRDLPESPAGSTITYKVILSCSPDRPDCRAIVLYNSMCALAFCCLGLSKEWTRIGDDHWLDEKLGRPFRNGYWDCVYSTRHEALFSLTRQGVLESWDLRDPRSPRARAVKIAEVRPEGRVSIMYRKSYEKEENHLWLSCDAVQHLVVAGKDLFVVTQYRAGCFDFDGLYVGWSDQNTFAGGPPYVTVDFDVYKYDPENQDVKYVNSLDGLAVFVGYHNDAFALPAAEFPELKPNCIYFTNAIEPSMSAYIPTRGQDIGIFDYKNKTVLPCYYPFDDKNMREIFPTPTWKIEVC